MTILIERAGLHLHDGEPPIPIGGNEWFEWLNTNPKSFRFECPSEACIEGTNIVKVSTASFTAVRAGKYWQAHRKANGILRREHLGSDDKLTYELMRQTACKISNERYWENRRSADKGKVESHKNESNDYETDAIAPSQVQDEITELRTENETLKQQLAQLKQQHDKLTGAKQVAEGLIKHQEQEISKLDTRLTEVLNRKPQPSIADLLKSYETDYETLRTLLPKQPSDLKRDWVHFWRFKTWVEATGSKS